MMKMKMEKKIKIVRACLIDKQKIQRLLNRMRWKNMIYKKMCLTSIKTKIFKFSCMQGKNRRSSDNRKFNRRA